MKHLNPLNEKARRLDRALTEATGAAAAAATPATPAKDDADVVALCHRFAGSDAHQFGTVRDGIDRDAQHAFLQAHHIANKTDCSRCWARPLCSGGCYHEAHTRYGETTRPNLHYCDWIRGWTDVCLRIYGELSERNPGFLTQFDNEDLTEMVS